jgi:fructuronate reductase
VTEKAYGEALAALIVDGLQARHAAGLGGLTVASCDNLAGNGAVLRRLCLHAAAGSPALQNWIGASCRFPHSMVDRIVPATSPDHVRAAAQDLGVQDDTSLGVEAFWEWVIEGPALDPSDAQALASVGVTIASDVAPYEDAKLRMLNASHSAMAFMGAVLGLPCIRNCIAEPPIHAFVHGLMTGEVGPQMRRANWQAYRDALIDRFGNPALDHSVHQIASDSSKKIPQRWPASVLGCMEQGLRFDHLAFASAAWMRYTLGEGEEGQSYALNDPLADSLRSLARQHAGDAAATVEALGTLASIWGDVLPQHAAWKSRVAHWLERIRANGLRQALAEVNAP